MCSVFRGRGELSTVAAAASVRTAAAATAVFTAAAAAAATAAAVTIAVAATAIVTAAAVAAAAAAAVIAVVAAATVPAVSFHSVLPGNWVLISQARRTATCRGEGLGGRQRVNKERKATRRISVSGEAGPGGRLRGMGCCR